MAEFNIGQQVVLVRLPNYVKTADSMPMLRSPSVLTLGETGIILDRRPGGYWAVRLSTGAYLLEAEFLQ